MLASALSLTLALLCAAPEPLTPPEERIRWRWMPPAGGAVEVFVQPQREVQGRGLTTVVLPEPVHHVEADPGATAQVDGTDGHRLWVSAGLPLLPGGHHVRVTLADGTELTLRLVARPNASDVVLTLRERPALDTQEIARQVGARLSRCQTEEERIAGVTRLIAERGSEAVLHRAFGDGQSFKQTNGLELSFVDVVHAGDISYATLRITNSSKNEWPINLEGITLSSRESGEVRIISRASERTTIPPDKFSRIVLAYETPSVPALVAFVQDGTLLMTVIP